MSTRSRIGARADPLAAGLARERTARLKTSAVRGTEAFMARLSGTDRGRNRDETRKTMPPRPSHRTGLVIGSAVALIELSEIRRAAERIRRRTPRTPIPT